MLSYGVDTVDNQFSIYIDYAVLVSNTLRLASDTGLSLWYFTLCIIASIPEVIPAREFAKNS